MKNKIVNVVFKLKKKIYFAYPYLVKFVIAKRRIFIPFITILLIAFIPSYYFYSKYQKTEDLLKNATVKKEVSADTQAIINKVGRLIELPKGEVPTIAKVSDKSKLQNQAFFARAQNGDRVLIYQSTKKAILYRESSNKIIEVGTVYIEDSAEKNAFVRLALYNGTPTSGLTFTIEQDLKAKIKNIEVVSKDKANRDDYDRTIVVNLTGGNKEVTDKLALELKGVVGELPEGEVKPENADILVIVGKEQ